MRAIVILVLIVIALAMLRMLVGDVSRAVSKAWKGGPKKVDTDPEPESKGRLVRDPETGAYVDEKTAVRLEQDGKILFFESETSRDEFLKKRKG